MWPKVYKDYPVDTQLKKAQLSAGSGMQGCEMHELNGWGDTLHHPARAKRRSLISILLRRIEGFFWKEEP